MVSLREKVDIIEAIRGREIVWEGRGQGKICPYCVFDQQIMYIVFDLFRVFVYTLVTVNIFVYWGDCLYLNENGKLNASGNCMCVSCKRIWVQGF